MKESCDCSLIKRLLKKRKNSLSTFSQCNNMNVNRLSTLLTEKRKCKTKRNSLRKIVLFYCKRTNKDKMGTPEGRQCSFYSFLPLTFCWEKNRLSKNATWWE